MSRKLNKANFGLFHDCRISVQYKVSCWIFSSKSLQRSKCNGGGGEKEPGGVNPPHQMHSSVESWQNEINQLLRVY